MVRVLFKALTAAPNSECKCCMLAKSHVMTCSFLTSPIEPDTVFNFNTNDGVTAFCRVLLATSTSKRQFKSV